MTDTGRWRLISGQNDGKTGIAYLIVSMLVVLEVKEPFSNRRRAKEEKRDLSDDAKHRRLEAGQGNDWNQQIFIIWGKFLSSLTAVGNKIDIGRGFFVVDEIKMNINKNSQPR